MDPSVLIIIAIIILVIVLIVYLRKSKQEEKSITTENNPPIMNDRVDVFPETVVVPETDIPPQNGPGTSSSLYIPPEMLGDRRNEVIREKVDETIRNFDWERDGGKSEFLYTLQLNKAGWICPYCEGENSNEDPICSICGTRIGA